MGCHLRGFSDAFRRCAAASAQLQVGDELRMNASGLLTLGYNGSYGNVIGSNHGLNFGADGNLSGSYHDPNFLNFTVSPYYNQSRADSSFQSLTDSSGVTGTANFFSGSHFPGYASYRYDRDSTGTFGVAGSRISRRSGTGKDSAWDGASCCRNGRRCR